MPTPQEFKMGTSVHKQRRLEDEDDYMVDEIVQCDICGEWVQEYEIIDGKIICLDCLDKAYYNEEDLDDQDPEDMEGSE